MTPAELRKVAKEKFDLQDTAAAESYTKLKKAGIITEQQDPDDKQRKIAKDSRTTINSAGIPIVYPFYSDNSSTYIICPHCGEIHRHGNGTGHRAAHCSGKTGYILSGVVTVPEPRLLYRVKYSTRKIMFTDTKGYIDEHWTMKTLAIRLLDNSYRIHTATAEVVTDIETITRAEQIEREIKKGM